MYLTQRFLMYGCLLLDNLQILKLANFHFCKYLLHSNYYRLLINYTNIQKFPQILLLLALLY